MRKKLFLILIFIISLSAKNAIPVMVGGAGGDACGTLSEVRGLDSRGDGFLAVRQGPSSTYQMIDKLHNKDRVYHCEIKGKWIGIIYGSDDCGVSSHMPHKRVYKGSCKSGWVYGKWLGVIAG